MTMTTVPPTIPPLSMIIGVGGDDDLLASAFRKLLNEHNSTWQFYVDAEMPWVSVNVIASGLTDEERAAIQRAIVRR